MQYFIGYKEYRNEKPFDPSLLVTFRKRLPEEVMNRIIENMFLEAANPDNSCDAENDKKCDGDNKDSNNSGRNDGNNGSNCIGDSGKDEASRGSNDGNDGSNCSGDSGKGEATQGSNNGNVGSNCIGDSGKKEVSQGNKPVKPDKVPNKGTLIIDATCTPADIAYPTDLELCDKARRWTEVILDHYWSLYGSVDGKKEKPRTYREVASDSSNSISGAGSQPKKSARSFVTSWDASAGIWIILRATLSNTALKACSVSRRNGCSPS